MEEKAQLNLEYLLVLVAIVAVAAGVGLYLKSAANTAVQSAVETP